MTSFLNVRKFLLTRRRSASALVLASVLALSGCGGGDSQGAATPATTDPVTGSTDTRPPGKFEPDTPMAAIQRRGQLIVGVVDDEAPFSDIDESTGSWVGFDVELAKILATAIFGSQIEGKIRWVPLDPRDRELALDQGRVDVALGRYTITQPRKRFVDFAGPYFIAYQEALIQSELREAVSGLPDLNGLKVCTVQGSTHFEALEANIPAADTSTVRSSVQECAAELVGGNVAAVVADHVDLLDVAQSGSRNFALLRTQFGQEPYGIGLKKGDVELRRWLNDTLEKDVAPAYSTAYSRSIPNDRSNASTMPLIDRY